MTMFSHTSRRLALVSVTALSSWLVQAAPHEAPTALRASDLVPASLLQGPSHKVDEQVNLVGGFPRFTIRSPYGTWQADGREMLELRISEIPSFKQMESISKSTEFGKAAKQALAAPVAVVGKLIESPSDTVSSVASGIGLLANRLGTLASQGASRVGDRVSGNLAEQPQILKPNSIGEGIAEPRALTSDPLGYNTKRREWAQQLKVDPYTNNALLSKKLGDFAAASFAGSFPVKLAIGVVAAPLSYTVEFNDAGRLEAYQYPPVDIEMRNSERLKNLGVSNTTTRKLLRNKYFTPTLQTALVVSLEALGNVSGHNELVDFAARAGSDIEARYVINSVTMLSKQASAIGPVVKVLGAGNVLTGQTADGKLIIPVPMDYIPWVKPVEDFALRNDLQAAERWLLVSGKVTPTAKQELASLGWRVSDDLVKAQ